MQYCLKNLSLYLSLKLCNLCITCLAHTWIGKCRQTLVCVSQCVLLFSSFFSFLSTPAFPCMCICVCAFCLLSGTASSGDVWQKEAVLWNSREFSLSCLSQHGSLHRSKPVPLFIWRLRFGPNCRFYFCVALLLSIRADPCLLVYLFRFERFLFSSTLGKEKYWFWNCMHILCVKLLIICSNSIYCQ